MAKPTRIQTALLMMTEPILMFMIKGVFGKDAIASRLTAGWFILTIQLLTRAETRRVASLQRTFVCDFFSDAAYQYRKNDDVNR